MIEFDTGSEHSSHRTGCDIEGKINEIALLRSFKKIPPISASRHVQSMGKTAWLIAFSNR
jgi:hypothetical protein